jgi:hypothetical protein
MRALLVFLLSIAFLPACTYNVAGTPTYESLGVARLNDFPRERRYQNLGLHGWGFYRPSFSEPTLADVWEALSEKVRVIGGNACIVRYEKVGNITARTLEVTCEVLKVE